jgi:hypothetical protein
VSGYRVESGIRHTVKIEGRKGRKRKEGRKEGTHIIDSEGSFAVSG